MNSEKGLAFVGVISNIVLALCPPVLLFLLQYVSAVFMPPLLLPELSIRTYVQLQFLIYSGVSAIIAGIWYRSVFGKSANRKAVAQSAISVEKEKKLRNMGVCVFACLLMAVGMQYVAHLVGTATCVVFPEMKDLYATIFGSSGAGNDFIVILYSIILGPIGEELSFRGISLHYAERIMPSWGANVLQALLFALIHGNLIKGTYCFILGLLLGYFCHRLGGIRYAVLSHIIFNAISHFCPEYISNSLLLNTPLFSVLGPVLVCTSVWLVCKGAAMDSCS